MTAKKKPGSQGEGPGRYGRDAGLVIGAIIPAPTDAAGFNDRAPMPQLPTNLEARGSFLARYSLGGTVPLIGNDGRAA